MNEPCIESREIESLVPHELQHETFAPPSASERQILRTSIEQDGIREPPDVTADGRIISGHTRIEIARELGWSEVRVRVRYDLIDEREIVRELVDANLGRRNLGQVAKVRAIVRRESPTDWTGEPDTINSRVIKVIAADLTINERHARRLFRIATRCPINLQQAVDDKHLTQGDALNLCDEPDHVKAAIAERVENGERAKDVVREIVRARKDKPAPSPGQRIVILAKQMDEIRKDGIPCSDDRLTASDCSFVLATLERWRELTGTLQRRFKRMLRQKSAQEQREDAEFQAQFPEIFGGGLQTNCPS